MLNNTNIKLVLFNISFIFLHVIALKTILNQTRTYFLLL